MLTAADDAGVREAAAKIAAQVENIRRVLRESIWAQARQYPVSLTPPQVQAVQVVVEQPLWKGCCAADPQVWPTVRGVTSPAW